MKCTLCIVAALAFFAGIQHAAAQTNAWTQLSPAGTTPPGRDAFSSLYSQAANRMIVFGGQLNYQSVPTLGNDVWVLTNAFAASGAPGWMQLSPAGTAPSPRSWNSAVYDSANNRMIIFGGDPNVGNCYLDLNDVWVLTNADGTTGTPGWLQLNPTGGPPSARAHHSAVYDSANNRMIVYGGNNECDPINNDVWVLSNANGLGGAPAWTKLSASGGPARSSFIAGYDPVNNLMIVFGGAGPNGITNDVWTLSYANGLGGAPAWTQEAVAGDTPVRDSAAGVYDPDSNTLLVFAGNTLVETNDVWQLSNANAIGGTPAWTEITPSGALPLARQDPGFIYNPVNKRMIIYGGLNCASGCAPLSDVWALPLNTSSSIGLWHLDEGSGTTTADSAGSHPGTLVNSPAWVTGVHSNALDFNGGSQYVKLNSGPILGTNSSFTIEAWVKPSGNSMYGRWTVYSEGNASQSAISLDLWGGGYNGSSYANYQAELVMNDGSSVMAPTALPVGEWHHIAAVLQSGVGGILYVDGRAVATNASLTAASVAATETDLGAFAPFGARYFGGVLDEVQVFDTARAPAQILSDYQQYTPPAPVADLAISESVSPNPVTLNSNATFTITVTNFGPDAASGILVTSSFMPLDFGPGSWVSMSQGTFTNSQQDWLVGTLAGNAVATAVFRAQAEIGPASNVISSFSVSGSVSDPIATNNTASVSVTILAPPPVITNQPVNETVSPGGTLTLSVGASGYSALGYQWLLDGTNIAGATGATFVVTNAGPADAGDYSVVVSNADGTVTSSLAVVTLLNLQLYAGLTIYGPLGTNYEVDYTDTLNTNWSVLTNFALPTNPYLFIDTTAPAANHRFYRAYPSP
ncbi:MAG: immunoglobulin domain-containing protein [Verrucomicrobiota bacterium]|nr:immunoglobulin domain-containing protein [Verrucomicrobiota bacterium]